jgi:hypothetical protein
MLKALEHETKSLNIQPYVSDFKRRFNNLLGF